MTGKTDPYEVLGVPRDASTDDIERARKRLALVWHPDRNQSADAAEHFDQVQKAAEVLRNPVTRAAFDRDFALRVAMSLPTNLSDRPPPPPTYTAPAYPPPTSTPPTHTPPAYPPPAHTPPAHNGRAHARPSRRRPRSWLSSRRARLSAGLAALVALAGIAGAFLVGQGHPASAGRAAPRSAGTPTTAGAADGTSGGKGAFPLPQYQPGQAVMPVNGGQVLSIGPDITLLAAGGHVLWRQTASVASLDTNPARSAGPHAAHGCVVDGSASGHQYDFISPATGQQTAVTAHKTRAASSMALAGNRVALPDGTIRDPCTGSVIGRAAPSGTFKTAECLAGPVVIGTGGPAQMAWKNGHKLWQRQTGDPVICDRRGSVFMLNPTAHKISLINPDNGRAHWTVGDPGCPHHCLGSSAAAVQVLGEGGTVLFSEPDQVVALALGNGKLLWQKSAQCALGARSAPSAQVLLGSCLGQASTGTATGAGTGTGSVTVAAAPTGAVVSTHTAGGSGCEPAGQVAASAHQLLVICPATSGGQHAYQARIIHW